MVDQQTFPAVMLWRENMKAPTLEWRTQRDEQPASSYLKYDSSIYPAVEPQELLNLWKHFHISRL